MKTFIAKYSLVIIGVIILFLFISGGISRCTRNHTGEVISAVEIATRQGQIIDSMRSIQVKSKVAAIDSTVKSLEGKIKVAKPKIKTLKLKTDTLLQAYKKDTASQSLKADSTIQSYIELTDSMNMENEYLSDVNEQLKAKITIIDAESDAKTASLDNCHKNNEALLKQLKKSNNWWSRNHKWFYFGGGAILTGLILR